MNANLMTQEDHRTSAEIEAGIRETRHRMDTTLDELGSRLTARSLVNSALDWWDSPEPGNQGSVAVRKAAISLGRQAKRHPMPAVLIGAGVAWLISESRSHDGPAMTSPGNRYQPRDNGFSNGGRSEAESGSSVGQWVGDKVSGIKETAEDALENVMEKSAQFGTTLHHATDVAGDRTHQAIDRGKTAVVHLKNELAEGYRVGADKFTGACKDYPLAVGVAFAALGALAGLVIPRTQREDDLMGEQSDHLCDETKEKASELLETGKEVGSRVLDSIKDEAREQGFTGDSVSDSLSNLADRGEKILRKAKDVAVDVADEKGINLPGSSRAPD
ncbi:MAG: DUF3618 domain-containing protein [Armatimonadetes bacterium]|nr:DUF3618 domain-containing protein [Akkermansiaceae bacterium]